MTASITHVTAALLRSASFQFVPMSVASLMLLPPLAAPVRWAVAKIDLNCVMARAVVMLLNPLVSARVAIAPHAQALVATRMCARAFSMKLYAVSANIFAKAPTGKCKTMQSCKVGWWERSHVGRFQERKVVRKIHTHART
jgi:hypothetical protein